MLKIYKSFRMSRFLPALTVLCLSAMSANAASDGVVYDLDILNTFPPKGQVDMSKVTWDVTLIKVSSKYNYRPGAEVSINNAKGTYTRTGKLEDSSFTADTRTFKYINAPEPAESGTYTMVIPQGTFGDAAWLENPQTGHSNPEMKVVWHVVAAGSVAATYDIEVSSTNPTDEATVDIKDNPFELTVTAPGELDFVPGVTADLLNPESDYVGKVTFVATDTQDGHTTFKTEINPPITHNGTYSLNIPQGMFGDLTFAEDSSDGHGNLPYSMSFDITGGEAPKDPIKYDMIPEISPADGSHVSYNDMMKVTLTFPEGTDWIEENSAQAVLRCSSANYYAKALFRREEGKDGTFYIKFGFKPYRDGDYIMVLNQGIFMDANKEHANPEITYTWHVSSTGIDSISVNTDSEQPIYDLNGLYQGTDPSLLPSGLYIRQGKKLTIIH